MDGVRADGVSDMVGALTESERKVIDSIQAAVLASGGPVELPFSVVAEWLSSGLADRPSKRQALTVLRSLIRKGYLRADLDWSAAHCAEALPPRAAPARVVGEGEKPSVFVVHGHDAQLKEAVARFIERLGFRAILVMELPSSGRTVIEQVERYSNVHYAVVLLTPDDMPAVDAQHGGSARARQNVIFELGYFVGRLGRSRVHFLRKGELQLFADIDGIICTPVDDPGTDWRISLAREMSAAGLDVDLNKVFYG